MKRRVISTVVISSLLLILNCTYVFANDLSENETDAYTNNKFAYEKNGAQAITTEKIELTGI